jgi:glutathione synthase/RimK-type ligase-like ATP-grasp enzyme
MSPPSEQPHHIVLVGHPGHKRVVLFQEALARQRLPPAHLVSWREVLTTTGVLRQAVGAGALVRLESPGQDFEVEKLLLAAGAAVAETEDVAASFLPADEVRRLPFDRGRLLYPRQWYRALRATLERLAAELADQPNVSWMNHPDDIVNLFDKRRCHHLFTAADLPVPETLGPVRSFEELLDRMRTTRRWRVFVKLACGSSAAGVVAFRVGGPRMQAITTVEIERREDRLLLYNTRRLRRYEDAAEVAPLINALCREGVQVEEWLPKAEFQGEVFDLRVLVIGGEVQHIVPRLSRQPMTNLHLLNRRGDPEQLRAEIPPEHWQAALETARRAASLFSRCLYVGVDLLLTPRFRPAVLEANAFGDLLPGMFCNGRDTYDAEVAALCLEQEHVGIISASPRRPLASETSRR